MVYDGISMHNCSLPPSVAHAYAISSCLTFAPMFVFSPSCLFVYSYPGVGMPPVQYAPPAYSQQTVQIPAAPQQWQYNPGQYVQAPLVNQPIQAPSQYMMPSLPIQAPVQQYPTAQSLYATPTYSATYGGFANPQLADGQPGMQPVS